MGNAKSENVMSSMLKQVQSISEIVLKYPVLSGDPSYAFKNLIMGHTNARVPEVGRWVRYFFLHRQNNPQLFSFAFKGGFQFNADIMLVSKISFYIAPL